MKMPECVEFQFASSHLSGKGLWAKGYPVHPIARLEELVYNLAMHIRETS